MDREVERLKQYLPADVVERLLHVVSLIDLHKQKERYRTLTLLCESLSLVLRYANYNLGKKQSDGHYEICKFYANKSSDLCVCARFRYALYDVEIYSTRL